MSIQKSVIVEEIKCLNEKQVANLISFLRNLKQSDCEIVVFKITNCQVEYDNKTVKGRYDWTRRGQIIRNLLVEAPHASISILSGKCEVEIMELAGFMDNSFALPNTMFAETEFPKWGTLSSLVSSYQHISFGQLLEHYRPEKNIEKVANEEECFQQINQIYERRKGYSGLFKRTGLFLNKTLINVDRVEAVLHANSLYDDQMRRIQQIETSGKLPGNVNLEDTYSKNHFDDYLEFNFKAADIFKKLSVANNTSTLRKMFEERGDIFRGKCIELGSGSGYFSIIMSRWKLIEKVVALDVSPTSIFWWGPVLWEKLKPDWQKLTYMIGDMNDLPWSEEFDCAVFCSSLHHSSDFRKALVQANKILKPGGSIVLFSEHFHPVVKVFERSKSDDSFPHNLFQWRKELRVAGFQTEVMRIPKPGNKRAGLKSLIYEKLPTKYLNGYFHIAEIVIIGRKHASI